MKFIKIIGLAFIILICTRSGLYLYNNHIQKSVLVNAPIIGEIVKIDKKDIPKSSELSDPLPSISLGSFDIISPTSTLSKFKDKNTTAKSFIDIKGNVYVIQNFRSIYKIEGDKAIMVFEDNEIEISNTDIINAAGRLYVITDAVYLVDNTDLVNIGPRTNNYMRFVTNRKSTQVYIIGMSELSTRENLFFLNTQGEMEKIGKFTQLRDYYPTEEGLIFSSESQLYFFKDNKIGKIDMKNITQQISYPIFYENNQGIYMSQNNGADFYKVVLR